MSQLFGVGVQQNDAYPGCWGGNLICEEDQM